MLRKLGKRAQTTAEYAILIALVVGAVVAMQIYVRRGLQGRIRQAVDHVGAGGEVGGSNFEFSGEQYEPYYISSTATTGQTGTDTEALKEGGAVSKGSTTATTSTRDQTTGWENYQEP